MIGLVKLLVWAVVGDFIVVEGCGVGVHLTLLERSLPYMPDEAIKYHDLTQSGAFFPDAFYGCAGLSDAAEDTHWPPFLKIAVDYWREKYGTDSSTNQVSVKLDELTMVGKILGLFKQPLPTSAIGAKHKADGDKLKAFIYGILSHQVSDVSWHSLGLQQGMLRMLANLEFNGDTSRAHTVLDVGGDMIMVRRLLDSGLDLGWLTEVQWDYPVDDILELFGRAGYSVSKSNLDWCMWRGSAALHGELRVARAAFISYAMEAPTLFSSIEDYYLGGGVEMVMSIRHCTRNLDDWFENGTPEDPWSICGVFEGRHRRKYTHHDHNHSQFDIEEYENSTQSVVDVMRTDNISPMDVDHVIARNDPIILSTGVRESLFGSSVALGKFLDNEESIAIGAQYESFLQDDEEVPKGSVYVMKESQIRDSSVQSNRIRSDNQINVQSEFYTFNERFGAQAVALNIGDSDVLAVSRPGISTIDFFIENHVTIQLVWKEASVKYGSGGEKLIGEVLFVGDIDGDGMDDLVIGAPRNDVFDEPQRGQVYVVTGQALKQLLQVGLGKSSPPSFSIYDVADTILDLPDRMGSYALFGSQVALVKAGSSTALLVGAPGAHKVFGFDLTKRHKKHIFTLQSDDIDNDFKSDFGGALLAAGNDGWIAVANSQENVGSCTQCGAIYLYRYEEGTAHRRDKIRFQGSSFSRFGKSGLKLDDELIVASPHAKNERGSVWRVKLNTGGTTFIETIIEEGPRPWSNGFGSSLAARRKDDRGILLVVGMPHFGTEDGYMQGAAAVYSISS